MRQVNRDELAYAIVSVLKRAPASTLSLLKDRRREQQVRGMAMIGLLIADGLRQYEVLCDRDLPALMGETAFTVPIARMLGQDLPSGVIPAVAD